MTSITPTGSPAAPHSLFRGGAVNRTRNDHRYERYDRQPLPLGSTILERTRAIPNGDTRRHTHTAHAALTRGEQTRRGAEGPEPRGEVSTTQPLPVGSRSWYTHHCHTLARHHRRFRRMQGVQKQCSQCGRQQDAAISAANGHNPHAEKAAATGHHRYTTANGQNHFPDEGGNRT